MTPLEYVELAEEFANKAQEGPLPWSKVYAALSQTYATLALVACQ